LQAADLLRPRAGVEQQADGRDLRGVGFFGLVNASPSRRYSGGLRNRSIALRLKRGVPRQGLLPLRRYPSASAYFSIAASTGSARLNFACFLRAIIPPADDVRPADDVEPHRAKLRGNVEADGVPIALLGRWLPVMRAIAPELIDILGEGGRLTLRNAAGQTIERHLGQMRAPASAPSAHRDLPPRPASRADACRAAARTNQLRRPDGLILRPNPASSVSQIAYSRGAGGSFRRAK
jgi:hypothetical protein